MFCSRCGNPVTPAQHACPACGAPVVLETWAPGHGPGLPAAGGPMPVSWPPGSEPDAGFWLRVAASLLDGFILGLPMVLLVGLLLAGGVAAGAAGLFGDPSPLVVLPLVMALSAGSMAVKWLYFALQESGPRQATLGKRALGLMVVDCTGRRIGFGRASGRFFGKILSSLTLNIGYLMAAFTARKQALHDLVAGTCVVRRRQAGAWPIVAAVLLACTPVLAGIVAAIAIPNYLRYQLRAKEAEVGVELRALIAAEAGHFARTGSYAGLELPEGTPGSSKLDWTEDDVGEAAAIGWTVPGASWATYRLEVAEVGEGRETWAACAETDLDGDGEVAALVVWQPVEDDDGDLVAPPAPCVFGPKLSRTLQYQPGDPVATPVRVSPRDVF